MVRVSPSNYKSTPHKHVAATYPHKAGVNFNFMYLRTCKDKFVYRHQETNYFTALIERLCEISSNNRLDLKRLQSLRHHRIDFKNDNVSERYFNNIPEEAYINSAYQFSISSNKHGRIHGFYVGDTFYIVWLDPLHELYAG